MIFLKRFNSFAIAIFLILFVSIGAVCAAETYDSNNKLDHSPELQSISDSDGDDDFDFDSFYDDEDDYGSDGDDDYYGDWDEEDCGSYDDGDDDFDFDSFYDEDDSDLGESDDDDYYGDWDDEDDSDLDEDDDDWGDDEDDSDLDDEDYDEDWDDDEDWNESYDGDYYGESSVLASSLGADSAKGMAGDISDYHNSSENSIDLSPKTGNPIVVLLLSLLAIIIPLNNSIKK